MAEASSAGGGEGRSASAAPPRAADKSPAALFREPGVAQRVACAAFAWAVTVAPFVIGPTRTWAARFVAAICLAAGVVGPLLVPARRKIGRHVGISAFVALATGAWLLSPQALAIERLDPILASIGAVAWGVYAFSWGEPWRLAEEGQTDELGGTLRARTQLPPLAVPIASLGVVGALALLILAWQIKDPSRALFGHAAAIGVGVALVSSAALVAISRGKTRVPSHAVPRSAKRAIVVLVVAAVLGGVFIMLRTS